MTPMLGISISTTAVHKNMAVLPKFAHQQHARSADGVWDAARLSSLLVSQAFCAIAPQPSRDVTLASNTDDMLRSNDGGVAVSGEFEAESNNEPAETEAKSTGEAASDIQVPTGLLMLPFAEARARALEQFDRQFLGAALARHSGNIARTARALGLHRQSLQKLMARRKIKSVRPAPVLANGAKA